MKTLLKNLFIICYILLGAIGLTALAIQSYFIGGACMVSFLAIALYIAWACK